MDARVISVRQFIWERCVGPLRPASKAAKSLGCTCADRVNGNKNDGRYVNAMCPVHAMEAEGGEEQN